MKRYTIPGLAVLSLTFAIAWALASKPVHKPTVPPAAPPESTSEDTVAAVGLVEPESEHVALSCPVSGMVTSLYVKAGDRVKKGERLFTVDDRDLNAELQVKRAALSLSEARLQKLEQAPRPEEVPPAEAKVAEAKALLADAELQVRLINSVSDRRAVKEEDVGVPENEHAMLKLAHRIGIDVPRNELVEIDRIKGLPEEAANVGKLALAVQRFDRRADGSRVHMEDFAQVFGLYPDDKYGHRSYANIASVLWAETSQESTYEFFRRVVFSVLIGNADMHLKNWSLLYPDRRTPVLSPAYDMLSTLPYIAGDTLGLSFGASRDIGGITKEQVRRFAETARIPVSPLWRIVTGTTERTVENWKKLDEREAIPTDIRTAIERQILRVAASVGRG